MKKIVSIIFTILFIFVFSLFLFLQIKINEMQNNNNILSNELNALNIQNANMIEENKEYESMIDDFKNSNKDKIYQKEIWSVTKEKLKEALS